MNLRDALFNWLQMHIVAAARPHDEAARQTLDFFAVILAEDHLLTNVHVIDQADSNAIEIVFEHEGMSKKQQFDREFAEKLLDDIRSNPKYNNE